MAGFHISVVIMAGILAKGVARSVSYLGLDVDRKRGNARLEASIGVRQRTREMYESLRSDGGHTGQSIKRNNRFESDICVRGGKRRWARGAEMEGKRGDGGIWFALQSWSGPFFLVVSRYANLV